MGLPHGTSLDLDFHTVPANTATEPLEKHYVSRRSRRQQGILVFLARDAEPWSVVEGIEFRAGWRDGRDPSAEFSTRYYIDTYADIRGGDINPLLHYAVSGHAEGRRHDPVASCCL